MALDIKDLISNDAGMLNSGASSVQPAIALNAGGQVLAQLLNLFTSQPGKSRI
jgi:hypothetical protein